MAAVYPVGLLLTGVECAVVGGDVMAADKIGKLLEAGAKLTVYAAEITDESVRAWAAAGKLTHVPRRLEPGEVGAYKLVLSLEFGDNAYHQAISEACRAARTIVNCFDLPAISDFSHPSQLRRGLLQIAVFTGGASPALGRAIRTALEQAFDDKFAAWLDQLNEYRNQVKAQDPEFESRKAKLYKAIEGFVMKVEAKLPKNSH
jgi:precorrin-2 dehydrogenase/sirohydrochlorin ferrochelatase